MTNQYCDETIEGTGNNSATVYNGPVNEDGEFRSIHEIKFTVANIERDDPKHITLYSVEENNRFLQIVLSNEIVELIKAL